MPRTSNAPWHSTWAWLLAFLVLLTLGIRFAEPVRDGDLWWQMAYGRYMIEHRTLVTYHSAFTWTSAESPTIYCAWLAEIFLYLLHAAGDLPVLFAFRYACLLLFVLAVWYQARRLGVARHPLTWLICLLGVLMSQNAAYIKPEIFSYVFMTLSVLVWLRIKSEGEKARRTCYLFPVLMLLWVNSHGGFIFGAVFLFVMGLGEGAAAPVRNHHQGRDSGAVIGDECLGHVRIRETCVGKTGLGEERNGKHQDNDFEFPHSPTPYWIRIKKGSMILL